MVHVILAGGAQAGNIFWQVGTSATIGTFAAFKGTILADQAITMKTTSTMEGRALARIAGVTFNGRSASLPVPPDPGATTYWLGTGAMGSGSVSPTNGWHAAGSSVVVTATPSNNWRFMGWTGSTNDCIESGRSLTVPMTQTRLIAAVFAASAAPVVSGRVTRPGTTTGVPGVVITFSGAIGSARTDRAGGYSMTVPYTWSGTATPAILVGGSFSPANRSYSNVIASQASQDFAWKLLAGPFPTRVSPSVSGMAVQY